MHTLEVTDEQLHMLHESVNSFINSFSHDQPEMLRAGKALRAKLDDEIARTPSQVGASFGEGSTFAQ
jgi:hypothetical protein